MSFKLFITEVLGVIAIVFLVAIVQKIFHISEYSAGLACGWISHIYINALKESWEDE